MVGDQIEQDRTQAKEQTGPDLKTGFQYFGAYLGGCWALLQLVAQFIQRAELANHWNTILLITLVGLIPSVLYTFLFLDRIQEHGFSRLAKYLLGANIAIVLILILKIPTEGDISTSVKNEVEEAQSKIISELTIGDPSKETSVFTVFTPEPVKMSNYGPSQDHLPAAFSESIAYRLSLNPHVRVEVKKGFDPSNKQVTPSSTRFEKARQTGSSRYFDGTYEIEGGLISYELNVRSAKNGEILHTRDFRGFELMTLMDSVSSFALNHAGLSIEVLQETPAIKFKEAWSSDSAAVYTFLRGKLDITKATPYTQKAIALDSTFAHAAGTAAYASFHYNSPLSEQKLYGGLAFRNRNRLPRSEQVDVLTTLQLIEKNWLKAEQLLRAQINNSPRDTRALSLLAKVCFWNKNYTEYNNVLMQRQQIENTLLNRDQLIEAKLLVGDYRAGLSLANQSLEIDASRLSTTLLKALVFLHMGEYRQSETVLEEASLLYPEWSDSFKGLQASVRYMAEMGNDNSLLKSEELQGYFSAELTGYRMRFEFINGFLYEFSDTQIGAFHYPNSDSTYFSTFFDGGYTEIGVVRDSNQQLQCLAQKTTYKQGFSVSSVVYLCNQYLDTIENEFIIDSVSILRDELLSIVETYPYRLYLQNIKDVWNFGSLAERSIDDSYLDVYSGIYSREGASVRSVEKRNGKLYYVTSPVRAYELRLCNDSTLAIVNRRSVRIKVLGLNTEQQRLISQSVDPWKKQWVDDGRFRYKEM